MPGHTKDKCFKLHEYPHNPYPQALKYKNNKGKRITANVYGEGISSAETAECGTSEHGRLMQNLTKEHYGQLLSTLENMQIGGAGENSDNVNMNGGVINFEGPFTEEASEDW